MSGFYINHHNFIHTENRDGDAVSRVGTFSGGRE
jgi:hypothetical protein